MYWKFFLAQSRDMVNIAELTQARSRQFSTILNRSGSASFSYPMRAAYADDIKLIESCVKAFRFNWRETLRQRKLGYRAKVWDQIWSGPVMTIEEDPSGADRMNVSAVGWMSRFDKRILRRDKNFVYVPGAGIDDGQIIFDLLAEINGYSMPADIGANNPMRGEYSPEVNSAYVAEVGYQEVNGAPVSGFSTIRWPAGSSPNLPTWVKQGSKLPNEGPGGATAYVPAYRGKNYQSGQVITAAVEEMTSIENGCDVEVDPVTRELNIYRRKRTIRDDVIFGFNWGPNNVAQLGRQLDGTSLVNYHKTMGSSGSIPKYVQDDYSMLKYGPLEEVETLSDVVDLVQAASDEEPRQSVLWTYSAAEIFFRSLPRGTFSITPFPYVRDGGVPEPFVDYNVGDQVRFTAKWKPRIDVSNLGVRVFGFNVSIDDSGNEKLGQLQIAPGS